MDKILQINHLSFSFNKTSVLKNLSLELNRGEITALIGVSGAGKSTLFKLITGILDPVEGSIFINGHPRQPKQVSYLTQENLLLPWRTVLGNLTLLGELGKQEYNRDQLRRNALEILDAVGLAGKESLFPDQLSGGMRQRVSLARALLQKSPLLLLDEPFGSLDICLRDQMYTLLRKIQSEYKTTMLLITHDFRDALVLADSIHHLADGYICHRWEINHEIRQDGTSLLKLQQEMKDALFVCRDPEH